MPQTTNSSVMASARAAGDAFLGAGDIYDVYMQRYAAEAAQAAQSAVEPETEPSPSLVSGYDAAPNMPRASQRCGYYAAPNVPRAPGSPSRPGPQRGLRPPRAEILAHLDRAASRHRTSVLKPWPAPLSGTFRSTAPAAGFRAMSQPAAGREQRRCSTPVLKVPRAMQNGGYSSHSSGEWNSGYSKASVLDDEASTRAPSRSPAFGSSLCSTRASSKSACDFSPSLEEVEDRKGTKAFKNACDRRSSIGSEEAAWRNCPQLFRAAEMTLWA
jgi:hypothetical protein